MVLQSTEAAGESVESPCVQRLPRKNEHLPVSQPIQDPANLIGSDTTAQAKAFDPRAQASSKRD